MHGSTRFSSRQIASTICAAAAPGAYHADVPSRFTISPPPLAVRSTIAWIRSAATSLVSGTPPTVVAETTGTIWSPCPPSTIARTSFTDAPVSQAMNVEKRAVSRMPAIPNTRSRGQPETFLATWHIASSGFETTIRIASGLCSIAALGDRLDDLLVRRHEVVAAHARRAREAGRDHDDVGARGLLVAVRAGHLRLEPEHGTHLVDVERLPCGSLP